MYLHYVNRDPTWTVKILTKNENLDSNPKKERLITRSNVEKIKFAALV